jgi:hypothetical protein
MLLTFLHNKDSILSTLAVLQLQDEFRVSAHEWEIIENVTKCWLYLMKSPKKSVQKKCIAVQNMYFIKNHGKGSAEMFGSPRLACRGSCFRRRTEKRLTEAFSVVGE